MSPEAKCRIAAISNWPIANGFETSFAVTTTAVSPLGDLHVGVTATAGFAVLIASDVSMLRDFGFVTVVDMLVALLGVMEALPAALAWIEER